MNLENKEDLLSYEKGLLLADEILSVMKSRRGKMALLHGEKAKGGLSPDGAENGGLSPDGAENGGLSPDGVDSEEISLIEEWIKDNPYAEELIIKLSNEKELSDMSRQFGSKNASLQVKRFYEHIERRKRRGRILRIAISVSAAAAIVFTLFFYTLHQSNRMVIPQNRSFAIKQQITQPTLILTSGERIVLDDNRYKDQIKQISQSVDPVQYNKLIVPPKTKFRLELEDGSVVFLNADSELSYPIHFTGEKRKLILHRGEAYFEVVKSDKQFEVSVDNSQIKVYGTKFNISYYTNDIMQTVLFEGSLGVSLNNINETIIHPGELITVNNITGDKEIKAVNTRKYLTWVNGFVCCEEEPLKLMLEQIARWYNVEFVIEDGVNTQVLINAYFSVERPITEILKSIEDITNVEFIKMDGGKYMVK
jgi:transmembrane sensor